MKKGFSISTALVLVTIFVTTITCSVGLPEDLGQSATVIEAVNLVDAHPRPEDDWGPAAVGMDIYGGGQVRTGSESSARLELLEGVVRIWAESIFTVRESSMRQGTLVTRLFLQEGRLWANLTTEQPHEFSVETASAVAAVRDTRFSVMVDPGQTTLVSVAVGEVVLTAQGESVTVVVGQQASVEPGQPPSPPEPMSDDERALWATEGDTPELAPPPPTATPTLTVAATLSPTDTPLPTDTPPPVPATETPVPTDTPVPIDTPTPAPPAPPTATPAPVPSQARPTILSIDFPGQIPADGTAIEGSLRFNDPDGNINWVRFDVVRATDFSPFEYNPMDFLLEGDVIQGASGFNMWCTIAQDVTLRVTLFDTDGNSSAPVEFSFRCQ